MSIALILCAAVIVAGIVCAVAWYAEAPEAKAEAVRIAQLDSRRQWISAFSTAAAEFLSFLREVDEDPDCMSALDSISLPVEKRLDRLFGLSLPLAAMFYCDVLDVYAKLGHSMGPRSNREAIGLSILLAELSLPGSFDFNRLSDPKAAQEFCDAFRQGFLGQDIHLTIKDQKGVLRFSHVFGNVAARHDLAQRYATHMHRWASLVAKADGVVTTREQAVLRDIERLASTEAATIGSKPGKGRGPLSPEAALSELDSLVGLEPVKREVRALADYVQVARLREQAGFPAERISLHCIFTGNPGTGKTTVARILATIFRDAGIVSKGQLVETDRSGLVAEYVGQTAVKTNAVVDEAIGGVLFVDEAYALAGRDGRDFGPEAIATLLKRMEDDRDDLIVILAGYPDEMESLLDSNPGLRSRFGRTIRFPDYSPEELAEIFVRMAGKGKYTLGREALASLPGIMRRAADMAGRSFGNARFVRNLFERAIQHQAVRLASIGEVAPEMLAELAVCDLKCDDSQ